MIYVYMCSCGKLYELMMTVRDKEDTDREGGPECPSCDNKMKQIITGVPFVIK